MADISTYTNVDGTTYNLRDDGAFREYKITTAGDLDTLLDSGIYHCTVAMTHAPAGLTNHATVIVDGTVGTKYQIFIPDASQRVFKRYRNNSAGTWYDWVEWKVTDTTYTAGTGLSLSSNQFSLASSGVTAGSYGQSAAVTGNEGATVNIPYITVDAYGRVTGISNKVYTAKNTTYTPASATPLANGTAAVGTSAKYAREDHVHPLQTTVSGNAGGLSHKTLDSTTINNQAGTFAFSGSGDPFPGCDWVGIQVGDSVDKFQIVGNGGRIAFRQNDSGGTNASWTAWGEPALKSEAITNITRSGTTFTATKADGTTFTFTQQDNNTTYTPASATPANIGTAAVGTSAKYAREDHVHAISLATGDANGQVKIAGTNVSVKGLGTAAYTASTAYAAAGHTHDYLPLAGGTVTGSLILSRTTDVSGTANNKPALLIGGTDAQKHIEIDNDEIQAKASGTTTSGLWLNHDGGAVYLSNGDTVYANNGGMYATTYKVNDKVTMQWNATDESLDFVFA